MVLSMSLLDDAEGARSHAIAVAVRTSLKSGLNDLKTENIMSYEVD